LLSMYYTKYRPQTFSEISKPNDVAFALSNQIKSQKTAHAYLFIGPRGTGKTTAARILSKALNCDDLKENGDPCDICDNCVAVKSGSFLDLIEIDAASNRGIDDIRQLKERIKLAPSAGKNKVYIIDEAHMLTPEAFNALLKTLEEPPANVVLILCTTEVHKVPETIKSRCQIFKFKRATIKQLTEKLSRIAENEHIQIDDQDLKLLASAAHGGFRDAETLLQQVAEGEINVRSLISVGTRESFSDFVDTIIHKDTKQALHIIKKLYEDGMDLYVWTGELLKYLRDLLFVQVGSMEEIYDATDEMLQRMKKQAQELSSRKITNYLTILMAAQNEIKNTFITQLPLEIAMIKICIQNKNRNPEGEDPQKVPTEPADEVSIQKTGEKTKQEKKQDLEVKKLEKAPVAEIIQKDRKEVAPGVINIEIINNNWQTIVTEVSSVNNSVSALLKMAKLAGVDGRSILLEVPFDFHKERLETSKNRTIIEEILSTILEEEMHIKCDVRRQKKTLGVRETGRLTDYNVAMSSKTPAPEMNEKLLDVFDGGLPLG